MSTSSDEVEEGTPHTTACGLLTNSEETIEKYQKHQEEGYDAPDAGYEVWLYSLPSAMNTSKEQSGTMYLVK